MNKLSGMWDVGLGKCKTEVAHANVHKPLWLLTLRKSHLLVKKKFVKYFHALVFLHKYPDGEFKELQ